MKPVTLRVLDLRRVDACTEQTREFRIRFGDKVLATVTNAVAVAHVFDWDWAAQAMLREGRYVRYMERLTTWSWTIWRESVNGAVLADEYGVAAYERHKAAAFAIEFLAQGGMIRPARRRVAEAQL